MRMLLEYEICKNRGQAGERVSRHTQEALTLGGRSYWKKDPALISKTIDHEGGGVSTAGRCSSPHGLRLCCVLSLHVSDPERCSGRDAKPELRFDIQQLDRIRQNPIPLPY